MILQERLRKGKGSLILPESIVHPIGNSLVVPLKIKYILAY